ncbi:MAG: hypothetical protein QOE29_1642 [Gaiellaceae bacterium]|nr:hypothetical protein [Gaiellaceae bacterium]
MSIAVAISTRDRPEQLARCLEALRAGDVLPVEVVVADQSEGEATRAVVDQASGPELPVRYLRARPGGLGVAQNDAVGASSSELVAILDDDCIADRRWLAELAALFAAEPALGLAGGRVLPLGAVAPDAVAVSSRTSTVPLALTARAMPWDVGSGNNFAVRRSAWAAVGGCDERLGPGSPARGGVDMDVFYRLLQVAPARYVPAALVFHERTTAAGRIARRSAYGYGTGACIALWLRERHDRQAWRVLGAWLRMRSGLLARAVARRRWQAAYEELLVLCGTAAGLVHGIRVARRQ